MEEQNLGEPLANPKASRPSLTWLWIVLAIAISAGVTWGVLRYTGNVEKDKLVKDKQEQEDRISLLEKEINNLKQVSEVEAEEAAEVEEQEETAYTGSSFITISSPANEERVMEEPVTFTGTVSPNTTRIVVVATKKGITMDLDSEHATGQTPKTDTYELSDFKKGDTSFTYRAKKDWNNLVMGTNEYEFKAYFEDGNSKSEKRTIFFMDGNVEFAKPVIYLYPEKTSKVFVNVKPTDGVSISDPQIGNGWNVIAKPDGKIYNIADKTFYKYLFWEGFSGDFKTPDEGFVVSNKDVSGFFDDKLKVLGLNEKEIADFKEFWVPKLTEKPYYFITFVPQSDFDRYAPLTVSPTPDTIIRVFFDYKGLDQSIDVTPQKLTTPERQGFVVSEWGGRMYR